MSRFLVLKNFVGAVPGTPEFIPAGIILDDAVADIAALQALGCPMLPWTNSTAQALALNAYLSKNPQRVPAPSENLLDLLITFNAFPGSGIGSTIIYRPGGVVEEGVVISYAALQEAVASASGPLIVIFDGLGLPIVLPAGDWVVPYPMVWRAIAIDPIAPQVVHLADGFRASCPIGYAVSEFNQNLTVESESVTSPAFLYTVPDVWVTNFGCTLRSLGPMGLFENTGFVVMVPGVGDNVGDGVHPVISMGPGAQQLMFLAGPGASISPEWVAGPASAAVQVLVLDAARQGFPPQPVAFLGSWFVDIRTVAANIAYSPAVPGDWEGVAPATAQDAIDRIAAAVSGLLAGPIP